MKTISFLLIIFLAGTVTQAQSLKKYSISNSGCSYYNYCDAPFDIEYSEDSSTVYTGECVKDEITYGVICVKLVFAIEDLSKAEELMITYADYLKTTLNITKAAGYGKGHRLNKDENTRGIIDYWEDADKDSWKIKCWTDGRYIGFMYAYSPKTLPEPAVDVFLDGFRFAELK